MDTGTVIEAPGTSLVAENAFKISATRNWRQTTRLTNVAPNWCDRADQHEKTYNHHLGHERKSQCTIRGIYLPRKDPKPARVARVVKTIRSTLIIWIGWDVKTRDHAGEWNVRNKLRTTLGELSTK
jgi:hypothetical protein